MSDIVLATLNAKYAHTSFGLRYLYANLGELKSRAEIAEFNINQRPVDIAESIVARSPKILGLGVYIWNIEPTLELVMLLKRIAPDMIIVLGGPEVSYETSEQAITALADYVICGEGETSFRYLCEALMQGERPADKIIVGLLPDVETLILPYDEYSDVDVAQRVVYVEASRGCPYSCEFCLSSLDQKVRRFPLDAFLTAMQKLFDRGTRHFKFIDRTFNLHIATSKAILEFFWQRYEPGMFLHFEMVPDRLPIELREIIARFPAGALQFEIGIQSFDAEVGRNISRRQDFAKLADNFAFLREQTGVHIHADLIVGLPGETIETFAAGFDRLVQLAPQEIQVGILKRLRGTPIVRHDSQWDIRYSAKSPYEILCNKNIDFAMMQRMKRFARYWDMLANSGHFLETLPMIWENSSPFYEILKLSDWLFTRTGQTHAVALDRLTELLYVYLTEERAFAHDAVEAPLTRDFQRGAMRRPPKFLLAKSATTNKKSAKAGARQAIHLS